MRRINLKRSLAIALAAATVIGSTFVPATSASAASKKKTYVVTESESNSGGKVKYSYNKNGLVSKVVFSDSKKSKSEEWSTKSTTKYSYNKKNRIKSSKYSASTTDVDYDTYYNAGVLNGERKPAVQGENPTTIIYNTTGDTAYTYDKKGKLTQKVETIVNTTINEGGTSTSSYNGTTDIPAQYIEDANGTLVRCSYNDDWDYSDYSYYSAIYYKTYDAETDSGKTRYKRTAPIEDLPYQTTSTTTTTIAAQADGSVTTTTNSTWTELDDSATSAAGAAVYKTYTSSNTSNRLNKTVITTTYTYDKKKRVKSAVATSVNTITTSSNSTDADGDTTVGSSTDETTTRTTDTYKYNKKGKATKVVTVNEPDVKSYNTSSRTETYKSYDGTVKTSSYTDVTTVENGLSTTVSSYPKDGVTVSTTRVVPYPANSKTITTTYKYDKQGNVKSSKATTSDADNRTYVYTMNADGTVGERQYVKRLDEDGDLVNDYPVYTTKVTTSTATNKKEVELKNNSKRLSKAIGMHKSLAEGESKSSYDVSRIQYKVKSKKAVSAAEKQQWIIQNGALNGQPGLDLD